MATFGEDLKNERASRGVSLEQIAQHTKVSMRHLRALEENRFEQLPGGVFNRGIMRSYLQFLNLDEADWMPRFLEDSHSAPALQENEADWLNYAQSVTGNKPSVAGKEDVRYRWLGILLLFLVLSVLGWLLWRYLHHRWHPATSSISRTMQDPAMRTLTAPSPLA
jgi:cytoskeletal protein RodZ